MSDSKKAKSAVEACREISRALRINIDKLKKTENTEYTPRDAALRVLPKISEQIKVYEEQLVKLRNLEKAEPALETAPKSGKELEHKYQLSKVFEVLGKTSIMEANRKQLASKPSDKVENAFRVKGSLLPSDKAPKEVSHDDSGEVSEGSSSASSSEESSSKEASSVSKAESSILSKKWKLGGKDDASKMATSHAMHAGSVAMNAKINKMPARQLPKLPSPSAQASRQSELASFMPKGKFDKSAASLDKASAISPGGSNANNTSATGPATIPNTAAAAVGGAASGGINNSGAATNALNSAYSQTGGTGMAKAFDAKGKFITPDKDPKKKLIPGKSKAYQSF